MRNYLRKTVMAGMVAIGALSLAACDPPTTTQVDITVAQVQSIMTTSCGYVAEFSTVAGVLAALAGQGVIFNQVSTAANELCSAIVAANGNKSGALMSARRFSKVPKVRGVAVTYHRA